MMVLQLLLSVVDFMGIAVAAVCCRLHLMMVLQLPLSVVDFIWWWYCSCRCLL